MTFPLADIHPFASNSLLLALVILLKWGVMHFSPANPFMFFRTYCQLLSDKVNKESNSHYQQRIAGAISVSINFFTITVILWLFADFIEVTWLWHGLLLFFAIDGFHFQKKGKEIAQAIVANNNYLAKQLLSPLMLRESQNLSSMGLTKAFMEVHILTLCQQLLVTCFYFLCFGPLAAFAYRLLLEMHYSWNTKQSHFAYFGQPVNFIVNVLQWLPIRIITLVLFITSLNSRSLLYWRLIKKDIFTLNNHILVHYFALLSEVKLGGVAMYKNRYGSNEKLRRMGFNQQARNPEPTDIIHLNQRIILLNIWLCALLISGITITLVLP